MEAWVYLEAGHPSTKMPIICNWDGTMCMYIENGVLVGQLGGSKAVGVTPITDNTWTQLIMRYNAEGSYEEFVQNELPQ